MSRDFVLIFASRIVRLFGFGLTSVGLALMLAGRGFSTSETGLLFTLTLLGDTVISLLLAMHADRWGRRRTLLVGGLLVIAAGVVFEFSTGFWWLTLAATIGVISPSGNEIGPFLAVEQAALAQMVTAKQRTAVVAWYNVAGFSATALGALVGGRVLDFYKHRAEAAGDAGFATLLWVYVAIGVVLVVISLLLSPAVEVESAQVKPGIAQHWSGLHTSRPIVTRLSALFALDAFAGGFIVQSFLAYWFAQQFGLSEKELGGLFFVTNLLSGLSALLAVPLARRIGLINTMVFTHLPSNVMLMAVPLMPSAAWAMGLLMGRHFLSQMDVPTRQSYVMAVVPPEERSAANGVTATVRSLASAFSPVLAGKLLAGAAFASWPILLAGSLKIVYDVALWVQFRQTAPPEER